MKALKKWQEAEYFLSEMRRVKGKRTHFAYELSAFLSACKSVAYYLRDEHGTAWYKQVQERVGQGEFKYIAYYLRKRDSNVHEDPLDILWKVDVKVSEEAQPYVSNIRVKSQTDSEGDISNTTITYDDTGSTSSSAFTVTHRYYFPEDEATGQDILTECTQYLLELKTIIDEANAEG